MFFLSLLLLLLLLLLAIFSLLLLFAYFWVWDYTLGRETMGWWNWHERAWGSINQIKVCGKIVAAVLSRMFSIWVGSLSWICGWFKVSNFLFGRSNIKYFGYLSLFLLLHWLYVVSMVGLWGRKCVSLGNFNLHRITTTEDYSGLGHGYKESRLVPQSVIALINDIFVQWFSHQ